MKPCDEGEMEGRRRSNANRIDAGRSTGTRRTTPHNDIDIDRYRWRPQQTEARQHGSNVEMPRTTRAATAPDTTDAFSVRLNNQTVGVPQETTGTDNFAQDTCGSSTSQEQARWSDMVFPDTNRASNPTAGGSHFGHHCKEKPDAVEEAKVEEQVVWDGMAHPDTSRSDVAAAMLSTDVDSSGSQTSNKNNQENERCQGREQEEDVQEQNDTADNLMAAGATTATTAPPPSPATGVGAFAICGNQTVQRGREADTVTQLSAVGTTVRCTEQNSNDPEPNQRAEDGSTVLIQAHLAQPTEEVLGHQEQRIQQLEERLQTYERQQQPTVPLVVAEVATDGAPQAANTDIDDDEMPPTPPVEEERQTSEAEHGRDTKWSWMNNRRNRCVALGLVAIVIVAVVIAVLIPPSNSSSSTLTNEGEVSTSTSPPSTLSPSSEPSVAPTTDTDPPSIETTKPTEPPTRQPTQPPTTNAPTQATTPVGSLPDGPWKPLGQELGGKAEGDFFGRSVSLSRDARVLAVGADQTWGRPGFVSVFESDDSIGSWVAKGKELVGEANGDDFGSSVALNGNGTILAVGAWANDGGGSSAGHVRVFQHDMSANLWVQLGSNINGKASEDRFGQSLSLSKAGDILAAGAYRSDNGRGSVRTLKYDRSNDSWEPLGQTLFGQADDDLFGYSVSLSSSGAILAIGARDNDSGGTDAGQLSMYQLNSASSMWDPMGSPINGQVEYGHFGLSVSLDDSGLVVVVGAPGHWDDSDFEEARVLVYAHNSSTLEWIQRGQALKRQEAGNNFGYSVSLSGNGSVLAVGSRLHDANGLEDSGQVTVFQYNTNTMEWDTVGASLNGKAAHDYFGESVSLSEDGTVVAVGAVGRAYKGNFVAGSASVYTLN